MLLGLEIGMFIVGVMAVFRGRLKFSAAQEIHSGAARLAGLILMAPVPVAFISGFAIGFHAAIDGRPVNLKDNQWTFTGIEFGITIICLVVAGLIVALADKGSKVEHRYDERGLPALPPEVQALLDRPQAQFPTKVNAAPTPQEIYNPDGAWLSGNASFDDLTKLKPKPPSSFLFKPALIGVAVATALVANSIMVTSRLPINDAAAKKAPGQQKALRGQAR